MISLSYLFESNYTHQLSVEKLKEKYPQLYVDPVHRWRAENDVELIHKEPDKKEQMRIWKNWNLMSSEMKELSDKKSIELFGVDNRENHNIMKEYWR
jgi:hypothetical protein